VEIKAGLFGVCTKVTNQYSPSTDEYYTTSECVSDPSKVLCSEMTSRIQAAQAFAIMGAIFTGGLLIVVFLDAFFPTKFQIHNAIKYTALGASFLSMLITWAIPVGMLENDACGTSLSKLGFTTGYSFALSLVGWIDLTIFGALYLYALHCSATVQQQQANVVTVPPPGYVLQPVQQQQPQPNFTVPPGYVLQPVQQQANFVVPPGYVLQPQQQQAFVAPPGYVLQPQSSPAGQPQPQQANFVAPPGYVLQPLDHK
jgi:hypothetical protein